MPISFDSPIYPGGLVSKVIPDKPKTQPLAETQAQYLSRMKAMKIASAGTGIKTMAPPKLSKPEVEELEQRK